MSFDPKQPIEEILAASAKARRAEFGNDPQMPNPMRARLHDEIARVSAQSETPERAGWFFAWWPRLAIGAALALLMIGAPLIWWRTQQPTLSVSTPHREIANTPAESATRRLADSDESKPSGLASTRETAKEHEATDSLKLSDAEKPAAASAPLAMVEKDRAESRTVSLAKAPKPVPAPASASAAEAFDKKSGGEMSTGGGMAANGAGTKLEKFAAVTIAPSSPPSAVKSAIAGKQSFNSSAFQNQATQNALRQNFRVNAKMKQTVNVLNNFQFEQNGNQVRVTDADGSVYTGEVHAASPDSGNVARGRAEKVAEANGDVKQNESNQFYFRATGSNRTLKKSVIFEANYSLTSPSPAEQNYAAKKQAQNNAQQLGARIVGVAKVKGEPTVEVDAIALEP